MTNFLCISVRFLDPAPAFHGRRDGGEPEWPPSPLRLFQALLDAAANRWRSTAFQEYANPALLWLESLPLPIIVTPNHVVGEPFRISVPNNDMDSPATVWARGQEPVKPHRPENLRTMKAVCPIHLRGSDGDENSVQFLYLLPDDRTEFDRHYGTLQSAARSITHLGWGIDMAVGDVQELTQEDVDRRPGERWQPVSVGGTPLRVPTEGTLANLASKHEQFLGRLSGNGFKPVAPLSAFRVVGYRRTSDTFVRPFAAFKLLHPEDDRWALFPAARANCTAAMTRHAAAAAAAHQPQDWVDSYVHGHRSAGDDMKPRFSYLPLPTIERRGPDSLVVGGIRRAIVTELVEAPSSHLGWARQMLPGQFLIDETTRDKKAMLAPLSDRDWVLQQYTGRSAIWATTTPVVLPGCDDGKFSKTEKLFLKALSHAGYSPDALAELEYRNVAFWPGVDLARRFHRADYLRKDHWSVYHMRIRWRTSMLGPIALGAGRHCGLGIFAAMKGD